VRAPEGFEVDFLAHDARPFLVTRDVVPPRRPLPGDLTWAPAVCWLLEEM